MAGWASLFGVWAVTVSQQPAGYRGLVSGQWRMIEGGDGSHRIRYMLEAESTYTTSTRLSEDDIDLCFGVEEAHKDPTTGKTCGGYVAWRPWAYMPATGHLLDSLSPLTIDGSVGCTGCPSHGFIKAGRWHDVGSPS